VAFAVGDFIANDGLLGSGKYKAGITATTLSPAENVGTRLTVGFTPNTFELVRCHYVKKDAATDEITPVVKRALALREGITTLAVADNAAPVDHLADIAAVLGADARVASQEVLHRLAELNPAAYRGWSFADLKAALLPHGAAPYVSHGRSTVSRERVLEALAGRDTDGSEAR
jgi:S-DNA-T family DNA segregation ATPase FtsK/SpoIIIE